MELCKSPKRVIMSYRGRCLPLTSSAMTAACSDHTWRLVEGTGFQECQNYLGASCNFVHRRDGSSPTSGQIIDVDI